MNPILQKIHETPLEYGEALICRLGQHSFLLKLGKTLVAIDPYLTNDANRLIPPVIPADEFGPVDLICCTHDHGDHLDRPALPALAAASPQAILCVPEAVRKTVSEFPAERLHGLNEDEALDCGDAHVVAVAAAHEFLDRTSEGLYPYLGYIISGNGVTLYHCGDCCRYEGLSTKLSRHKIDIMCLTINGRDAWKYTHDIIGNMTYQEAADLAGDLQSPLTIPTHYDMFAGNMENPKLFTEYMRVKYPALKTRILSPGEIFHYKVN